ncbi:hypothetical protein AB0B25_09370 [Nocardia sp. NPDC049190]|uniref:hypothetical protein n=1 Tax=Nocardia sp. NPDC049190 TaxID=3155650 RepID=UPI0033CCCCFD
MTDVDAVFDAVANRLAALFAHDLAYLAKSALIREKYDAGVKDVVAVTEAWEPTEQNTTGIDLDLVYHDLDGRIRSHVLVGIDLAEFLRDAGVRVPRHRLTWTVRR